MRSDRRTLREVLGGSDVLGSLAPKELDDLVAAAREVRPKPGTKVWRWGERGTCVAVVIEGSLMVCRPSPRGQAVLRTVGPDRIVGFSGLAGEAHTADLVAGPRCRVALIPNSALLRLLQSSPGVAVRLVAILCDLVGRLTDELGQSRDTGLEARVARFLLREASGDVVEHTHARIATSLGATRAGVSRALGSWRARGALRCERGRVVLLRPELLAGSG